jgi:hypothetical protein
VAIERPEGDVEALPPHQPIYLYILSTGSAARSTTSAALVTQPDKWTNTKTKTEQKNEDKLPVKKTKKRKDPAKGDKQTVDEEARNVGRGACAPSTAAFRSKQVTAGQDHDLMAV